MRNLSFSGSVSLKIVKEQLDFNEISNNLTIKPTVIYRKGQKHKVIKTIVAENDSWYYTIKFKDGNFINALEKLLKELKPYKEYIKLLSKKAYTVIRCSISSDNAQIYVCLEPKIIQEIAKFNFKFEFSILSFGEIED